MSRYRYELMNRFISEEEALATRVRAEKRYGTLNIADPVLDEQWGRLHVDSQAPNSYYDYFFSGQDIRVYVAELGDDFDFGDIPIHAMGFNVTQEKVPLYGYWSYTHDAVMRGTRLITGSFTVVTKYPDYMKKLLAKAAKNRASNYRNLKDDYPSAIGDRRDERNIDQYWGKHLDTNAILQQGTEWSIHPPFSFVVVYGIQNASTELADLSNRYDTYKQDNALLHDHNERLVEGYNPDQATRIILDKCELISVERAFSPNEPLIMERYEFFAKDIFIPPPRFRTNAGTGGGNQVR